MKQTKDNKWDYCNGCKYDKKIKECTNPYKEDMEMDCNKRLKCGFYGIFWPIFRDLDPTRKCFFYA